MNADVCLVFKIFLCYFFCIPLINNRRIDSLSGAKRPGTKQTHIVITDNQVAETLWSMVLLKCTHFNETPTIHCIRECTYLCSNQIGSIYKVKKLSSVYYFKQSF